MTELTELETHRRLITAQIKRELADCKNEIRRELIMRYEILESRMAQQQHAINVITERLMNLALTESKVINQSEKMLQRNDIMLEKLRKVNELIQKLEPPLPRIGL